MEKNHIYQFSLANALMSGVCETGIKASELLQKSCTQGLGTFSRLNGELVLLDGKVYRLLPAGNVEEAGPDDQIPFATVINFAAQSVAEDVTLKTKDDIDAALDRFDDHATNLFLAYRIDGVFAHVKYRCVMGQQYAGQPLSEVGKNQTVEEHEHIEGSIVGFRSPQNWQGFSIAGEHLHFLSKDKTKGGHVLEARSLPGQGVKMQMAVASNVHIELPTSEDFNAAKLATDDAGIKAVES